MTEVKVLSPATVSNVVCGFDCLGFALDAPFDEMILSKIDGSAIEIIHNDNYDLPTDPKINLAGITLDAFRKKAGYDGGFRVEIKKGIKPGSGIGSSSASTCGAAVAANELLQTGFSNLELVEIAMIGEMSASAAKHADNLAPCIFGGFTLVRSVEPLDIVPLDFPELFAVVIHPQIEIKTSEARGLLPTEIPLKTAIKNWANLGSIVSGLAAGDLGLIGRSMVDEIVEPARQHLIPKFDEIRSASIEAGAIGGGISGSGPSMFMLCENLSTAENVRQTMQTIYDQTGIEYLIYISAIADKGVRVV